MRSALAPAMVWRSLADDVLPRLAPAACGITRVDTSEPLVALTFDDGPHPDSTPAYLDLLREHEVRATFFPLGVRAERYPDLIARTRAEGHAIGLHGWNHRSLTRDVSHVPSTAWRQRRDEARHSRAVIAPTCTLFRPAYGQHNPAVALALRAAGFRIVQWSVSADDWLGGSAVDMAEHVITNTSRGAIILWHDAATDVYAESALDRSASLGALALALPALLQRYRLVTVPDLLARGRAVLRAGGSSRRSPGPGQFTLGDL